MSYVGGGWRSGRSTDPGVNTGAASTCTVTTLSPTSALRGSGLLVLTVNGTGFTNQTVVYANYSPQATTYVSATQLTVARFSPMPDSGQDGTIPIGVVKPGEKISNVVNFTAGVPSGVNYDEKGRSVAVVSTVAVTDTLHVGATPSAVRFNGGNAYLRSASGLAGTFTMCCWAKIVVNTATYTSMLAQGNGAANYFHFGTGGTGILFARDATSGASANMGFSFTVGTWYFIACVNDTAGGGVDIMGYKPAGGAWTSLVGAPGVTVTGPADANSFYIGRDSYGDWLNGSMAAVKIWTVALTEAEVQAEAFTYAPVKTSGLWAAYKFNSGPQTTDDSGNGRTLSASGSPALDTSGPPIT